MIVENKVQAFSGPARSLPIPYLPNDCTPMSTCAASREELRQEYEGNDFLVPLPGSLTAQEMFRSRGRVSLTIRCQALLPGSLPVSTVDLPGSGIISWRSMVHSLSSERLGCIQDVSLSLSEHCVCGMKTSGCPIWKHNP